MAAGIPPPRSVRANGWLLFDQGKMSKSRGNIVRAETVEEVLGADALRYFLLREIPFGQDGSFSFDALVQLYNGDLANGYGNLVSRVVSMVHKYFGGVVPNPGPATEAENSLRDTAAELIKTFGNYFDTMEFSRALETVWVVIALVDFFLTSNAPWKKPAGVSEEAQQKFRASILYFAAENIRIITALVYPILPESAAKVWRQLGQGEIADAAKHSFLTELHWGGLKAGTKFGEPAPLFPRAEKDAIERMQNLEDLNNSSTVEAASAEENAAKAAAPAKNVAATPAAPVNVPKPKAPTVPAAAPTAPAAASTAPVATQAPAAALAAEQPSAPPQVVTIDDFAKIELRVAQILVAERVPKADKLLRLEVDLGYEKRQILAGIAQYYEPEKLIGRKIVIVANLAPRKMRGLESNGMLLAASLPPDGAPVLAGFLEEVPLGARLR
jgi:methionyl-tRNA synthetase